MAKIRAGSSGSRNVSSGKLGSQSRKSGAKPGPSVGGGSSGRGRILRGGMGPSRPLFGGIGGGNRYARRARGCIGCALPALLTLAALGGVVVSLALL